MQVIKKSKLASALLFYDGITSLIDEVSTILIL